MYVESPPFFPCCTAWKELFFKIASESRVVTVALLNGLNYATWKVQCRMALLKEGLWGIVKRKEQSPDVKDENFPKFLARKDKALAASY